MTDNTIPLPDAIRAFKDRPSMEIELSALRAKCQRYEAALRQISICGSLDRLPSGKFWQGDRFDYAIETAHNALNKKEDK